jgi:2-oxoisovalerate dehydrogenase E2 component (dihydrolipoyl transacylase)
MPTTIELPQVGESVTEGTIGKWLVRPGAWVEKYAPLVEVMTDKVNMEVPSPFSGTLVRILADEGEMVLMGAPIAEMEVEGGAAAESVHPWRASGRTEEEDASGRVGEAQGHEEHAFEFMEDVCSVGPTGSGVGGLGRAGAPSATQPTHPEPVEGRAGERGSGREEDGVGQGASVRGEILEPRTEKEEGKRLSPLVKRLVAQHGVDVKLLHGTGAGGRITKEDVLRHVEAQRELSQLAGARPDEEETWLTPLRRSIAERMARSAREVPAAWTMVEVDVSGLMACRERHLEGFQRRHQVPLTALSFIVREVAHLLPEHPRLNSRWGGNKLYVSRRVHVGIAVATLEGLMVPVVHDADSLGVRAIAERVHDLAEWARAQALRLEDVQGGTFTVNNTGALGSVASYPIINYPQAAILTTEAVVKRPVVADDGAVVVRSMMNVGLAFDHRVCDGADASAFLSVLRARLEAITEETALV